MIRCYLCKFTLTLSSSVSLIRIVAVSSLFVSRNAISFALHRVSLLHIIIQIVANFCIDLCRSYFGCIIHGVFRLNASMLASGFCEMPCIHNSFTCLILCMWVSCRLPIWFAIIFFPVVVGALKLNLNWKVLKLCQSWWFERRR